MSASLTSSDDALVLHVRDDGRGFDPTGPAPTGIGRFNMQQRARAIGADLEVESEPGAGTTITCILPKATARDQTSVLDNTRYRPAP